MNLIRRILTGAAALAVLGTAGCLPRQGCCHREGPPSCEPAGCCPAPAPCAPAPPPMVPAPAAGGSFYGQPSCCGAP